MVLALLDTSAFSKEPYIERPIHAREICRVEIPFRNTPGKFLAISWEFMSRFELAPYFGLYIIPDQPIPSNLLEQNPNQMNQYVLVPFTAVQSYTRPAHGSIPLSHLNSGVVLFVWDNACTLSKNRAKQIAYKAMVIERDVCVWSLSVTIPRMSVYTLPILLSNNSRLECSFDCNIEIPFSMVFEPAGSDIKTYICPPRKLSTLGGTGFDSLDVMGLEGVMHISWDNSQAIVSNRHLVYHFSLY